MNDDWLRPEDDGQGYPNEEEAWVAFTCKDFSEICERYGFENIMGYLTQKAMAQIVGERGFQRYGMADSGILESGQGRDSGT
jgi:hypothetical protein